MDLDSKAQAVSAAPSERSQLVEDREAQIGDIGGVATDLPILVTVLAVVDPADDHVCVADGLG